MIELVEVYETQVSARRGLFSLLCGTGLLVASCGPERTIAVTTTADGGPGSLRAAIDAANTHGEGRVRIELAAGTYQLTRCGAADDTNATGDLDLTSNVPMKLVAAGDVVIRQTCVGERVLDARGTGLLTLVGVTLSGGSLVSSDPAMPAQGGGLRARSSVKLDGARIVSNSATGAPGTSTAPSSAAHGGGLFVEGSLEAINSVIESNRANGGGDQELVSGGDAEGGGAYVMGRVALTDCTFSGNHATGGSGQHGAGSARGGALAQATTATANASASGSVFSDNSAVAGRLIEYVAEPAASASGGALALRGPFQGSNLSVTSNAARAGSVGAPERPDVKPGAATGGGLAGDSAVSLEESHFYGNQAEGGSGYGRDRSVLCSPGSYYYCTGPHSGGGALGAAVYTAGNLTANASTFSSNSADGGRGGALFVYYSGRWLELEGNSGYVGGAAYSFGALSLQGGELRSNGCSAAESRQDAVIARSYVYDNGRSSYGHGIVVAGQLTLAQSTVSDHTGNGITAGSLIVDASTLVNNRYAADARTTATFINATLSSNNAGIRAVTVSLDHTTIAGDGLYAIQAEHLTSHRSAVVMTNSVACSGAPVVAASDHNWFSDASCGLTGASDRQQAGNFDLSPLGPNGGLVATLLPGAQSVLVDAIPLAACALASDARGVARPQGRRCDIGAVERTASD